MTAFSVAAVATSLRDRHQAVHVVRVDDALGDLTIQGRELAIEEVELTPRALDGQLLIIDEPHRRQPHSSLPAEQVTDLRTAR